MALDHKIEVTCAASKEATPDLGFSTKADRRISALDDVSICIDVELDARTIEDGKPPVYSIKARERAISLDIGDAHAKRPVGVVRAGWRCASPNQHFTGNASPISPRLWRTAFERDHRWD